MISVGIDVSKEKSMVCLLRPFGEVVVSPYEVEHTESSLSELVAQLKLYDEEIKVVMESTGAYHLPITSYLQKLEKIYALAKNSVTTLPSDSPTTEMLIHEAVKVMRQVNSTNWVRDHDMR